MGDVRSQVISALGSGAATCDEIEERLGLGHKSVSPRFAELVRAGEVEETGEYRETRAGRPAKVYGLPGRKAIVKKTATKPKMKTAAGKALAKVVTGKPARFERPTVTKKCQRCKKKRAHSTFLIAATGKTRTAPWCRECECSRRSAARAKAKTKGRK